MGKDKQGAGRFADLVMLFDDKMRAWRQLQDVSGHPEPAKRFAELCEEYRLSTVRLVRVLGERTAGGVLKEPSVPTGGA